jgi:hypothetical protein
MPKIGRNDPCYCGSGKKYKQCHLPLDEAAQTERRRLRQAQDTLLPKLIEATQGLPEAMPAALERFWNSKYTSEQLGELDDLEWRGADRFLTWFAFDVRLDDGQTLVERLASGKGTVDFTDDELRLVKDWAPVRLRPYVIERITKGQAFLVRDLLDNTTYEIEDHAASRRVEVGEVLVAHLLPAAGRAVVGGAVAHLTADTRDKLHEYALLYLEALQRKHPNATWHDLVRERSEIFNHFVMALPIEEADPNLLEKLIVQTRVMLRLAGESIGIGRQADDAPDSPSRNDTSANPNARATNTSADEEQ